MELRATRQMRRNEQISRTTPKKAEESGRSQVQSAPKQAPADKLTLSRQALAYLEEQNRKVWEEAQERERRRQEQMDGRLSALEGAKNELDVMGKLLKVQNKCQKIAASIIKGNRVPPEDLEYLMNNDPEGYKLAMAMRRHNPDPEDEKSVLDEEDRNGRSAEGAQEGGGEPAPSVSAGEGGEAV